MALNTLKCNHLASLGLKGLTSPNSARLATVAYYVPAWMLYRSLTKRCHRRYGKRDGCVRIAPSLLPAVVALQRKGVRAVGLSAAASWDSTHYDGRRRSTHALTSRCYHGNNATAAGAATARIIIIGLWIADGSAGRLNVQLFEDARTYATVN